MSEAAELNDPGLAQVSQTVTASQSGRYRLTAKCATDILSGNYWLTPDSVLLSVYLNGRNAGSRTVTANTGYQVYTIQMNVAAGDQVEVRYTAPATQIYGGVQRNLITPEAWAVIDDVSLVLQ